MSNMLTIDAAEFINVIYLLAGYKSDASRLQKLFENMQICLRGSVISAHRSNSGLDSLVFPASKLS